MLAHSKAQVLFVEYPLWRAITQAPAFREHKLRTVLVTEAPPNADLAGGVRWEEFRGARAPEFRPRAQTDTACIVYSSGTGGHPRGCVLTHDNYLEQCAAVTPVFPFWPGARYLSIIPTNHAIDFMGGFLMPFTGGGTVVHLRTLRPEFIREAFTKYKITYMAVVPLILKNLQRGLREKFAALPPAKRKMLDALIGVNRALTHGKPRPGLSRVLLKDIHKAFGGGLQALLVGGAFTEPATIEFFHDIGIPIYNGYGCTEACTAITLNDLRPFRPDTVGKPVRGMEIRIVEPDADGIGEVAVRSKTVMSEYLDDPEMTAETIVNGWLMTGDLGRVDATGHLQLFGRKKNMIVTAEGKNIYPEDIENNFEGIAVKEFCVFAANYIWPQHTMTGEQLVLVLRPEPGHTVNDALLKELSRRNAQLLNYKRVSRLRCLGPGFSAQRRDENQARHPCRTDRQATRPRRDGLLCERCLFHDRESGGRRRTLRKAGARARSSGCAPRDLRSKCAKRALPEKPPCSRTALTPRAFANSLPWAATARALRSSTDFFQMP